MRLRNIGTIGWRSQDFDGAALSAMPGQEVEMSPERAAMVLKDYPKQFIEVVEPAKEQVDSADKPAVRVSPPLTEQPRHKVQRRRPGK